MISLASQPNDDLEPYEGDLGNLATAGQARAVTVGAEFKDLAREWLLKAGAVFLRDQHMIGPYRVEGVIYGANQQQFIVLAHGVVDDGPRAGLRRTDTIRKTGFDAIMIQERRPLPVLVITSHLPTSGVPAELLADWAPHIWDVFATTGDLAGFTRLRRYLHEDPCPEKLPAPWRGDTPSSWQPELFDSYGQSVPSETDLTPGRQNKEKP